MQPVSPTSPTRRVACANGPASYRLGNARLDIRKQVYKYAPTGLAAVGYLFPLSTLNLPSTIRCWEYHRLCAQAWACHTEQQ